MERDYANRSLSEYWPTTLDLNHSELAGLASCAAVEVDNHIIGRGSDVRHIRRLGKIIYLAFVEENSDPLPNFYERQILSDVTGLMGYEAYREFGQELIQFRNLPKSRQEELRGLCVSLSKEFGYHWNSRHPHGFRQYAA